MISGDDFRFQRHSEIWKEQNKIIKRVMTLTLLFGFLILIRVLIPFNENEEKYTNIIKNSEDEKISLETQNEFLRQIKSVLLPVQKTIGKQPWMIEKDKLIRTFQEINRSGHRVDSQQVANATISTIAEQVRNEIVNSLKSVIVSNTVAAEKLELSKEIDNLREFIDDWERDLKNQQWFSTIVKKDREMTELTRALNTRMSSFSSLLNRKLSGITDEIKKQRNQIKVLETNINEANINLEKVMEELFPKWLKGILSVEQMIQIYPLILLALFLYVFWIAMSLSKHYSYMAARIKLDDQDKADISASSIWTLTNKGKRGTLITLASYILFLSIVWVLFEGGSYLLLKWLTNSFRENLLLNSYMYQILPWAGRLIFMSILIGILFNNKIKLFQRPSHSK